MVSTPCSKEFGTVRKFSREGDSVTLYSSEPNGCGVIGRSISGYGGDETILCGVDHFRGSEGSMKLVMAETRRIPVAYWNALRFLQCCTRSSDGDRCLADNAGIGRMILGKVT